MIIQTPKIVNKSSQKALWCSQLFMYGVGMWRKSASEDKVCGCVGVGVCVFHIFYLWNFSDVVHMALMFFFCFFSQIIYFHI